MQPTIRVQPLLNHPAKERCAPCKRQSAGLAGPLHHLTAIRLITPDAVRHLAQLNITNPEYLPQLRKSTFKCEMFPALRGNALRMLQTPLCRAGGCGPLAVRDIPLNSPIKLLLRSRGTLEPDRAFCARPIHHCAVFGPVAPYSVRHLVPVAVASGQQDDILQRARLPRNVSFVDAGLLVIDCLTNDVARVCDLLLLISIEPS